MILKTGFVVITIVGISERFSSIPVNLFCYTPNQKSFDKPMTGKIGLLLIALEL